MGEANMLCDDFPLITGREGEGRRQRPKVLLICSNPPAAILREIRSRGCDAVKEPELQVGHTLSGLVTKEAGLEWIKEPVLIGGGLCRKLEEGRVGG